MFPITDTKKLRRDSDGYFRVAAKSFVDNVHDLCAHCARRPCSIRQELDEALLNNQAMAPVLACKVFEPDIGFSVLEGLDADSWNTIRLGEAWSKRLQPGVIVAIADLTNRKMLRRMEVKRVEVGTVAGICRDHGERNHYAQAKKITGSLAASTMMKVMRNAYGSTYAQPQRPATVIYLKRIS